MDESEKTSTPLATDDTQRSKLAPAARGERLVDKIYLALLVAVLSFAGGVGGTLLASHYEADRWQRETAFSLKKEIYSKRTELLERTIKDFNRLQILDIYKVSGSYSLVEGEQLIRAKGIAGPSLDPVVGSVVRIKEEQAELSAVLTLDMIYFGPKTQESVRNLQKSLEGAETWWHLDPAKTQAVLDALAQELNFGF